MVLFFAYSRENLSHKLMFKHLRASPITYSQYFIAKRHLGKSLAEQIPKHLLQNHHVIEIGPGKGRLTEFLAQLAKKLTAIEVDYNFWRKLKTKYKDSNNTRIICGDFMDFELPDEEYVVVSNLPFFLSRAILLKLLKAERRPQAIYVILQKEQFDELERFAQKYKFSSKIIRRMRRADYEPMPKVESVYVEIVPNQSSL